MTLERAGTLSTQLLVGERARAGQDLWILVPKTGFGMAFSRGLGVGNLRLLLSFCLFSNFRNSSMLSPEVTEKGFCFGFVSLSQDG